MSSTRLHICLLAYLPRVKQLYIQADQWFGSIRGTSWEGSFPQKVAESFHGSTGAFAEV